jgi:adenine-specific DNA-methyltransferase
MKGYVPTPLALVDQMVERLFGGMCPAETDYILDPGCGDGPFIDGVLRWCAKNKIRPPRIVGVELNPALAAKARKRFRSEASVEVVHADYLLSPIDQRYRFVIGNPPYVSLEHIEDQQRRRYRSRYVAARGRFDLYMLFFEKALHDLEEGGRLILVTPEKYLYVASAAPLRSLVAKFSIESIELVPEATFVDRTVYPAVTTVYKRHGTIETSVRTRTGIERHARLPVDGSSWWPFVLGHEGTNDGTVPLSHCCVRISAGIATGADSVFVRRTEELSASLKRYAHPALAGKDLALSRDTLPVTKRALLIPYDHSGALLPEMGLGALGIYLRQADIKARLMERTCVAHKPWYAFHDNCPLPDIRRPKILCKDIGQHPKFWIDRSGSFIPLHTVYYIVLVKIEDLDPLCAWLNGPEASTWLTTHCQRAANGFLRLQSRVLQNLPVPAELIGQRATRVA